MNTKYKIEITEGCTAYGTSINGRDVVDIHEEEMDEIVDYLLAQIRESYNQSGILFEDIVRLFQYDDYEHDSEMCEQCGDTVSTTIWNI
jgi:hypothetical protein